MILSNIRVVIIGCIVIQKSCKTSLKLLLPVIFLLYNMYIFKKFKYQLLTKWLPYNSYILDIINDIILCQVNGKWYTLRVTQTLSLQYSTIYLYY